MITTFVYGLQNGTRIYAREKRWGGYGGYGPPQVPYVPNSNIAIGYPTAYGLGNFVRPPPPPFGENGYGSGTPSPRGFPVRCMNGGAHIGQCRLDDDAICVALGGTCVNSACCTTPFIGLLTVTPKSSTPDIVDGEAATANPRDSKSEEESEETDEDHQETRSEERRRVDEERKAELMELARLIEISKRTYTTPKPIVETSDPEISVHWTVPGLIHSTTIQMPTTSAASRVESTTSIPSTTNSTVNRVEISINARQSKVCESGLKAVGPCDENEECPEKHFCEHGQFCCFSYE
uniref:WAP domain-containing protein n=1 Tax=Acrobeloides nanus TaxID=290746 RepID=A0A914D2L9_9BILA